MNLKKVTAPTRNLTASLGSSSPRPWSSFLKLPTVGEPHWTKATIIYANLQALSAGLPLMAHLRLEDRVLGGYFARYTTPPFRIEMQLYTRMSMASLRKIIMAYKFNNAKPLRVTFEKCCGSQAHATIAEMVLQLRKNDQITIPAILDVLHWLFNMAGFSYLQEASIHSVAIYNACRSIPGWTEQPIFGRQARTAPKRKRS